jgi:hypothetical protein
MSKIYFIVGTAGTGTTSIATSLVNMYRHNNQSAVIRTLGIPQKIDNTGTKQPAETLDKIVNMLAEDAAEDAVIFMGWRVPDHINEIYSAYSSATFVFSDSSLDDSERRIMFEKFVTPEQMLNIISTQKTNIDTFISTNSLSLDYTRVGTEVFNSDKSLNLDSAGTIAIAVVGSI